MAPSTQETDQYNELMIHWKGIPTQITLRRHSNSLNICVNVYVKHKFEFEWGFVALLLWQPVLFIPIISTYIIVL